MKPIAVIEKKPIIRNRNHILSFLLDFFREKIKEG